MWGSAFAASLDDICLKVVGLGLGFLDSFKDVIKVVGKNIKIVGFFKRFLVLE